MSSWFRWEGADLVLNLRVQPRAARDGFAERLGDAIKVRIAAAPVDGEANGHLVEFLAGEFGVGKRDVQIEHGHSGRSKRVRICRPAKLPSMIPKPSGRATAE